MQTTTKLSPENLSKKYEAIYKTGYGKRTLTPHRMVLQTIPRLFNHKVETIFEIGCGRGTLLNTFSSYDFCVTGTEIVNSLLTNELASYCIYPYLITDLHLIQDASYDFVLSVDVLDHVPEDEALIGIQESWRIARKGIGIVVNGEKTQHQILHLDQREWRRHIKTVVDPYSIDVMVDSSGAARFYIWKTDADTACNQ